MPWWHLLVLKQSRIYQLANGWKDRVIGVSRTVIALSARIEVLVAAVANPPIPRRQCFSYERRPGLHGVAAAQCRQAETVIGIRFNRCPIERQRLVPLAFIDRSSHSRMKCKVVAHEIFSL